VCRIISWCGWLRLDCSTDSMSLTLNSSWLKISECPRLPWLSPPFLASCWGFAQTRCGSLRARVCWLLMASILRVGCCGSYTRCRTLPLSMFRWRSVFLFNSFHAPPSNAFMELKAMICYPVLSCAVRCKSLGRKGFGASRKIARTWGE
jgi:hypothetical protein